MRTTHRLEQLLLRLPHAYQGIHVHWPHLAGARRREVLFERVERTGHRDLAVLVVLVLGLCALIFTAVWMSQEVGNAMTIASVCDGKCEPIVVHAVR